MPSGMANVSITYQTIKGLPDSQIYHEILALYKVLFEDADPVFFKQRMEAHPKLYSVLAYDHKVLIGFKIGYPTDVKTFYSWVGGIHPEYRRQGIATNLAGLQEAHARTDGYTTLKTKSMNRFKFMMILNLKRGFNITQFYTNEKGQTKIVFEKQL